MANTASAAKAARASERKRLRNRAVKTGLHNLKKRYLGLISAGQKDQAATLFSRMSSALDKAAKRGVIHPNKAARQKSRLALRLAALKQ
ncbi:MAG: 30S ribosomal protein S20 [Verrucomicrobiae bacterium]|nr:30S ribosomal protein S20 [Verrucomicrobiae bacterium]